MDPSLSPKQSMEDYSQAIQSSSDYVEKNALGLNKPHHSWKHTRETCSDDDEHDNLEAIPMVSNQTNVITVQKCKADMQSNLEMLTGEHAYLKKENKSLKKDNALMNGTLGDQAKEIDQLRNDLFQLKCEHKKQNVFVQTLSGLLSDPVRLENEKLKDENASLKKNTSLNNLALLAVENAKLRTENKVLRVQNDALCGKIISDNDRKREEK